MGDLSADFIAPASGGFEPQRRFNFFMYLRTGLGGSVDDTIRLSIERGFAPAESSEEITLPYGNSRVYVAGQRIYEAGRIMVRDFVDKDVYGILRAWREQVQDAEDNIGFASRYKKTGRTVLVGPDTSGPRSYQVVGLWPQQMRPADLSYTESAVWNIEMVLRFDKAIATA